MARSILAIACVAVCRGALLQSSVGLRRVVGHARATGSCAAPAMSASANPLLQQDGLPRFTAIDASHVEPAVTELLAAFEKDVQAFEEDIRGGLEPTWASVVDRLETSRAPLEYAWGVVNHLMGVRNSEALREAHAKMQPEVVKAMSAYAQSRPVFEAFKALGKSKDLDGAQRRIVDAAVRDAELNGVGLQGEAQEAFNKVKLELAELSTKFSNNVLDATKAFALEVTDPAQVEGFPDSLKALTAAAAAAAGHEGATAEAGPWRITLDMPCYLPLMQHAKDRSLREEVYRAFVTRAGPGSGHDNGPVLTRVLQLRQQMAEMLGYDTYADVSIASKMSDSKDDVAALTDKLAASARPAAERELAALREFAAEKGAEGPLALWDLAFWGERQREALFDYTEEDIRPFLPLDSVLEGLFSVASRLFGVKIAPVPAEEGVETWAEDVTFYGVWDEAGERIASFFLDPYARPAEKRGGAWMDVCLGRSSVLGRKPVAYLTCNGSPPTAGRPSLMTWRDMETLFHEMGHGLQHMLTTVPYADAAGINNVEWDAVELPSQFMEHWCYHKETVDGFARHYETGEAMPAALFDKVSRARNHNAGLALLRQLYFGRLDMELHSDPAVKKDGFDPFAVQRRVAEDLTVLPPLKEDAFLCSFNHIFAGGYAAGYHSYVAARVLSDDAFSAFEEKGLEDAEAVQSLGRRFRETVLARGGGEHPMDVYRAFRGRDPEPEALLRQSGLLDAAQEPAPTA